MKSANMNLVSDGNDGFIDGNKMKKMKENIMEILKPSFLDHFTDLQMHTLLQRKEWNCSENFEGR